MSSPGISDDATGTDFDEWQPTPLWERLVDGILAGLGVGDFEAVLEL